MLIHQGVPVILRFTKPKQLGVFRHTYICQRIQGFFLIYPFKKKRGVFKNMMS